MKMRIRFFIGAAWLFAAGVLLTQPVKAQETGSAPAAKLQPSEVLAQTMAGAKSVFEEMESAIGRGQLDTAQLQDAEKHFAAAYGKLQGIEEAGSVPAGFREAQATLLRYRAVNAFALGHDTTAASWSSDALVAARQSKFRDGIEEAKIRTAAASVAVRRKDWTNAMHFLQPALLILYGKSKESNFNQELLREPLWLYALATAGAGEDAAPEFEKFLLEFRGKLKPEVTADVYARTAFNILARMPNDVEASRTDEKALAVRQKRKNEQERARQLLGAAMRCVDQVPNKNSVLSLTVAIEKGLASLDQEQGVRLTEAQTQSAASK